jgi:hypothetical protein
MTIYPVRVRVKGPLGPRVLTKLVRAAALVEAAKEALRRVAAELGMNETAEVLT